LFSQKQKVGVKNIKNIAKGGIVLAFDNENDCIKTIETINANTEDLTATKPKSRAPKLVVYNVSEDINEDNLVSIIIESNSVLKRFLESQNIDIKNKEEIEPLIKTKFKFRRKSSNDNNTWVLEISPKLRKAIFDNMRSILIGWKSCKFADYIPITRCFKCNGFGHIKANCRQEHQACGHCGQSHDSIACNTHESQAFCVNCDKQNKAKDQRFRLDTNHSSFNSECPSLKRIKNLIIAKTNYE
jgi:hypothetical protein